MEATRVVCATPHVVECESSIHCGLGHALYGKSAHREEQAMFFKFISKVNSAEYIYGAVSQGSLITHQNKMQLIRGHLKVN